MDDKSAHSENGRAFVGDMLWRGVCADHWGSDSLYGKARGILHTSALVIAAMVVGTIGIAEVYGVDLANVAEIDKELVIALIPALSLGSAGLGAMLAAMLFAAIALGIFKTSHLFKYGNFTRSGDGKGGIDDEVLDRCVSMAKEDVYEMYRAYIYRMRDLQRNNRFVGLFVVFGQWSLFAGIANITALAVFLHVHMIGSITAV